MCDCQVDAGQQHNQHLCQADSLFTQFPPHQFIAGRSCIACVKNEVDDPEYRFDAFSQHVGRRHAVGDGGIPDLALGSYQALRHGGQWNQKGAGDLRSGQTSQRMQGQCYLCLQSQRRLATGEHQLETLVRDRSILHLIQASKDLTSADIHKYTITPVVIPTAFRSLEVDTVVSQFPDDRTIK